MAISRFRFFFWLRSVDTVDTGIDAFFDSIDTVDTRIDKSVDTSVDTDSGIDAEFQQKIFFVGTLSFSFGKTNFQIGYKGNHKDSFLIPSGFSLQFFGKFYHVIFVSSI